MDAVDTEEGWLLTPDGSQLYTKTWKPSIPIRARLVFLHGFSDHCNRYGVLFPILATQGIKTYAFDQRGWGRSAPRKSQRGLTGPTSLVMEDITSFVKSLPKDETAPLFLGGHSMGGGEVAVYASTGPPEILGGIRGFLLESPLIGLAADAKPFRITVALGRWAAKVAPHMQMLQKLDPNYLSRDGEACRDWEDDKLCHDTATLQGLVGLLDRTDSLDQGRLVLQEGLGEGGKTRVWIGHGTEDRACSYDASRRWYERIPVADKEFKTYEGWYHQLHTEPEEDKVRFAQDVADWILKRAGGNEQFQSKSKL